MFVRFESRPGNMLAICFMLPSLLALSIWLQCQQSS